jgi:hypothetical protein
LILDQDPTAPPEPLFKQLGWMSIEQRIKYHKYLLVSKCLKNEAPVYLKNKKVQFLPLGFVIFHLQHFGESKDFYQTSIGFYFLNIQVLHNVLLLVCNFYIVYFTMYV